MGLVLGMMLGGCPGGAFLCSDDSQCEGGQCEASGYCSFPDEACLSGQRYGEHSPTGLAGECVEFDGGTGPSPTTGPSEGTTPSESNSDGVDDSSGPPMETDSGMPLSFTDDQWEGEFGAGSVRGLLWSDDAVRLVEGAPDGVLISRPFDAQSPATWTTLRWWPLAPYGKPLPEGGSAERGYAEDAVDMQGNLLLLHLDVGEGPLSDGEVIPDLSGTGHDAVVDGDGAGGTTGRFGTALADGPSSRLLVDAEDFEFGEGDFSWAMWVRFPQPCGGSPAMMGLDGATSPASPNVWLACGQPGSWGACSGSNGGRAIFTASGTQQASGGGTICSASTIDDGQWHHVAATKQGHVPATLRLYVDGNLDDEDSVDMDGPLTFPNDVELSIGAHPGDMFQFEGDLDEVAIWGRALAPEEVAAMYRRGVLRMDLAVRVCDDPSCAAEPPFEGPVGDGTPFVDGVGALMPGIPHPLTLEGRVIQYRLHLETLAPGLSPGLSAVTLDGTLP